MKKFSTLLLILFAFVFFSDVKTADAGNNRWTIAKIKREDDCYLAAKYLAIFMPGYTYSRTGQMGPGQPGCYCRPDTKKCYWQVEGDRSKRFDSFKTNHPKPKRIVIKHYAKAPGAGETRWWRCAIGLGAPGNDYSRPKGRNDMPPYRGYPCAGEGW